jgi:ABC-type multidrug transport system fused ATPase/permease subunit
MYIGVYGAIGTVMAAISVVTILVISLTTLTASKKMHFDMLDSIMRSPMAFFDTTPLGRIVNR